MNKPKISVVLIVYNEEYIIERTITSYYNELKGKIDFEMIIAEDGSTDGTKGILKKLKKKLPIRLYMSDKRKGYLKAVKDSLKHPKYNWIFLVDSDYQFDPADFWKLLPYTSEYDLILGKKVKRRDKLHRIALSKGFNFLLRQFFNVPFIDMNTGFRLINRKVLDSVLRDIHCLKYFTSELVIRAYYQNFRIKEVPVTHLEREKGKSNIFPIRRIPSVIVEEFTGLCKLKSELKSKYF